MLCFCYLVIKSNVDPDPDIDPTGSGYTTRDLAVIRRLGGLHYIGSDHFFVI